MLLIVLIASFPVYNLLSGRPIFDATELSAFDIVQTTAIIFLIYIVNAQRHRIEMNERRMRDIHEGLSIKLSDKHGKN